MTQAGATQGEDTTRKSRRRPSRSLLWQITIVLSAALLPIGLIALDQNWRLVEAARVVQMTTVAERTNLLVQSEKERIYRALGIVEALTDTITTVDLSDEACNRLMAEVANSSTPFQFVGLTDPSGVSRCNNFGQDFDMSELSSMMAELENPTQMIGYEARSIVSGMPAVIISGPAFDEAENFMGIVSISLPAFEHDDDSGLPPSDKTIVSFNMLGELLTRPNPDDDVRQYFPKGMDLRDFVDEPSTSFIGESVNGETRAFAATTLVPGTAYALGSWALDSPGMTVHRKATASSLALPILMWAVGIVVAIIAINRLVLHYIRDLDRRMRSFADGRRIVYANHSDRVPKEIHSINQTFESMATKIIRDEAELENVLNDKEILLREVHHRVKNNLQLISSIINMQLRSTGDEAAHQALRIFQDRVHSLASVHRALYAELTISKLRVDEMMEDLLTQMAASRAADRHRVDIMRALDAVTLAPDQAVGLALLTTEVLTCAIGLLGTDEEGKDKINVRLTDEEQAGSRHVTLSVHHVQDPDAQPSAAYRLGCNLINAFAMQLDGEVTETVEDGWRSFSITFEPDPICTSTFAGTS